MIKSSVFVCVCVFFSNQSGRYLCVWEFVYLHIPAKPCIISFSLSCPKDELETASFDFLAFDMAASHHQWLDETRAAALRGSSLTPSLSLSPPFYVLCCFVFSFFLLQFSCSCTGQVNLIHMTVQEGPRAEVSTTRATLCCRENESEWSEPYQRTVM